MISVLINAYAVSPNHGSEPGVGWKLVVELAKYCTVYVVTEAEFKNEILAAISNLPQKNNIHFYFNDIGENVRKICWNQGDYRFYYYYRNWQKRTYEIAIEIISCHKIDIIYQLNMIGFREPGYLWKIKEIPFIWGPIGGFVFIKLSFLFSLGFKNFFFYSLKNVVNFLQATFHPRVRKAIFHSKLLFAASMESKFSIKKFYKRDSILLNETGCNLNSLQIPVDMYKSKADFNILWVGRFIPTKMLNMALEVVSNLVHLKNFKLHIVGSGNNSIVDKYYQDLAINLGINQKCIWYGNISHTRVQGLMSNSDILLFTSIVEGTSHVVLESIANNLPIVCFDTCGHGGVVDSDIGVKIPVSNPIDSVQEFSKEIEFLFNNRKVLNRLSDNCREKVNQLSWEKKGEFIFSQFKKVLQN
jgi:glycosyltransferase involved in cell wall biosynthesis